MNLKIVIACLNYDDYLAKTLPLNLEQHKDITIVTGAEDHATQKVCQDNNALCVISHRIHINKAPFAKGKAINDALDFIKPKEWVLLLDADIILTYGMIDRLRSMPLDKDKLYYTRRILDEKTRASEEKPWGYFQLFNVNAEALAGRNKIYEEKFGNAAMDDSNFGLQIYSTEKRKLLLKPFFDVIHISHGQDRINWNGRVSPRIDKEEIINVS